MKNDELRMKNLSNQLPSFWKEGCPPGGVVGKACFNLFIYIIRRIGVAKAAYLSYHLPLRVLLLPEGGELITLSCRACRDISRSAEMSFT